MNQLCGRLWVLAREPEGPLVPYLDTFAKSLDAAGFKRHLLGRQIRVIAHFSRWLQSEEIAVEAVTDDHAGLFLGMPAQRKAAGKGGAATLRRFVDFLRRLDICTTPTEPGISTQIERIVAEYAKHLRQDRCLSPGTIGQYCRFAKSFLSERFEGLPVTLNTLRGLDVIEVVRRHASGLSPAGGKAMTIALRSFCSYIRYCGEAHLDLTGAVPTVPNWSMTGIPRAIAADHFRSVLASCRRDTPIGRRDYA